MDIKKRDINGRPSVYVVKGPVHFPKAETTESTVVVSASDVPEARHLAQMYWMNLGGIFDPNNCYLSPLVDSEYVTGMRK